MTTDQGVIRPPKQSWRRHFGEYKSRVVELARQDHGLVPAMALANGANANMLRHWVREAELADAGPAVSSARELLTMLDAWIRTSKPRDNTMLAA